MITTEKTSDGIWRVVAVSHEGFAKIPLGYVYAEDGLFNPQPIGMLITRKRSNTLEKAALRVVAMAVAKGDFDE